ncbi:YcaO-like family protein [Allokutzneria sp. A3M-2-11 16]|uniref:YcaO-like family protein n=1 Tax=Allokutzneria sp. A3M-2-11 16 TaxID=2962043 RepID=UPI0020B8D139|nr:YcaO-like family protein [Allokutzneria sp. A3M-2-11 16]MCP3801374.1 YcaO-like family protein [Allokutzneria sp. A3M-2-11 16]
MGLLLRPDVYRAETDTGSYLLTHSGPVTFNGKTVHQLIDRLAPALNGTRSLADLVDGLPTGHADMVTKLLTALIDRDVVREVSAPPTAGFLGYFHDSADEIFERYQALRTTVVGSGPLATALASSARRSGLATVAQAPRLNTVDGVDLVLHATDDPDEAAALDELCADITIAQIVVRGDHAWLIRSGPGRPGWSSAWRRLSALNPAPGPAQHLTELAVTALAAQLVQGVFRDKPTTKNEAVRVDLSTLDSKTHAFLRVGGPQRQIDLGPLTPEEFSQRAAAAVDDLMGVLSEPSERHYAQVPLRVCEVRVAGGPRITAAGPDFATARYRAAMRGLAAYSSGTQEGVAAGYSRQEAIDAGLIDQCRRLTLAEARTTPASLVELDSLDADPRYRALVNTLGEPVTVYDITGSLGLPTVVCFIGDEPVGCASAFTPGEAVTEVFEQALLHHQSRENRQPEYAPPAAPEIKRGTGVSVPQPCDHDSLVARLEARGLRLTVTPLDHDPEVHAIMPHIVRVVIDNG